MRRGDVYDARLDPTEGSEQAGWRPVVVVSRDAINRIVHGAVARFGGSISAEHGLGQLKREAIRELKPPLEMELMRKLKDALDPLGLMNPGKVL